MNNKVTGTVITNNGRRLLCPAAAIALTCAVFGTGDARAQALTAGDYATARDAAAPASETDTLPARLRRQIVDYRTNEAPGTIVVDTPNTYLYFVLGGGRAIRYGVGVGREGFTWSGAKTIERKTEWPDWIPPTEMLQRQPYLPRFMAGGMGNPLGARAMYLSGTEYRIHGTNAPATIGSQVSSGCIRMLNEDVIDLYNRTHVGTRVVVLPMSSDVVLATDRPKHLAASVSPPAKRVHTSSLY
jgi:lipoprotein-anchoring transpeptidase ErfK/SrfK